jgi:hypothetical protein
MDIISLAGSTVVAAAVTDAWESARRGFARWFGRGQSDAVTERRLDATRDHLAVVPAADAERVRAELAGQWATRVSDLLEEHPGAEAELHTLVEEIRAMLPAGPVSAADHSVAAGRDVSVRASGGSVAAGVIAGSVAPPGPTLPGPVSG